jgi:acyl carrier protein
MFSSITAIVTATGQANYISANSFLDGLADYRRGNGQTALSIAWGPWDEGMIKKLNLQEVYMQKGMTPITGINGISVLERIIKQNIPYALVIEADWIKIIDSVPRNTNPYLDHLKGDMDQADVPNLSDEEILKQFQTAYINADQEEREMIVRENVMQLVGKVLHLPIERMEMESSLSELGIDSMMTTELKNRLEMNTGAVIPIVDLLNNQSLYQLVKKIQEQLENLLELNTMDELIKDISEEELENMMKEIMVGTV